MYLKRFLRSFFNYCIEITLIVMFSSLSTVSGLEVLTRDFILFANSLACSKLVGKVFSFTVPHNKSRDFRPLVDFLATRRISLNCAPSLKAALCQVVMIYSM